MRKVSLLVAVALLVSTSAFAAEKQEHQWMRYVGALGSYGLKDKSRGPNVKDSVGIELLYGSQRDDGWGYEINGYSTLIETGTNSGTDNYRWGLGGDAFYAFRDRLRLTPFLLAGGGYGRNDVAGSQFDKYDWFLNAGAGAVTRPLLWDLLRVRGEVRYIYDDYGRQAQNSHRAFGDWQFALGVEFGLSRIVPPAPVMEERVRVVQVGSGLKDSDDDGIVDNKDDCPDTPADTRVDGHGCTLPKVLRLDGVTFEFDKARLRPDSRTILKEVAQILHRYPDMEVEIAGHTDSMGSEEYNLKLSQRRAEAVRNHLIALGVNAEHITAVGYGEIEPVDTNDTDAGREVNRRVEMRVKN